MKINEEKRKFLNDKTIYLWEKNHYKNKYDIYF